jgi:type IV pilus assembly protein PilO
MALTFNDFKQIKPRNQALIVIGVAVGGLALFWYAILMPISQENATLQSSLDSLNSQIAIAEQRAQQLAQIRAETQLLEVRLAELTSILPLERETEGILEEIRTAAEEVAMTIVSVVPQGAIEREVYSEWPWSFQVQSTYHSMALFLDRVRTIPRMVNVSSVAMRTDGDGVTSSVSADFTATTFVYREVDELEIEVAGEEGN